MAKRGPKRKAFDWNILEALAGLEADCSYVAEYMLKGKGKRPEEYGERWKTMVASMCKRIVRNIQHVHGCNYVQFIDKKRENKRIKLREFQWKAAESGNVTMMIWLGKQMLGQSEKTEAVNKNSNEESKLVIQFSEGEKKNAS